MARRDVFERGRLTGERIVWLMRVYTGFVLLAGTEAFRRPAVLAMQNHKAAAIFVCVR